MKVLFAHNSIFQFANGLVYSSNIPQQVWHRYLVHFDKLVVVGRAIEVADDTIEISTADNVDFIKFPDVTLWEGVFKQYYFVNLAKKYISESQVSAVIVRLPSQVGIYFLKAAVQLNLPVAVEVVGDIWNELWYRKLLRTRLLAPYRFWQMREAVKKASHVIYVTEEYLQRIYPCKGERSFASNVDIQVLKDKLISKSGVFQITTVGSLDFYYKGYDVVLKALSLLKKQGISDFMLNCAGDGTGEAIRELAKQYDLTDSINILGILTKKKLYTLLDNTDLYIQPSRTEGLPRALIEAMSRGCPALASTAGGIPELLDVAYLHKPGDYKKLANDIKNLLLNEDLFIEMSRINLCRAADYLPSVLEKRRHNFWASFNASIKTKDH
ncbi:glycosyltransferase family 4 protein [Chitinophaga defluvii]|uniref:Glycosyltransferase family 4 protein n=1 Tax=Chitinophaga defluvii TaxID=3163343 RepID=A0ABV2T0P2_9BACT